jgi:protein ImuB
VTRSIAVVFPRWQQQYGALGEQHAFTMFEHVVRSIAAVSPLVEVEEVGTVVMAARGPSRYFGGDVAVARMLHDICSVVDSPYGVGVADSRFAATAAAHLAVSRGTPCVVDTSIGQQFLFALPVASLAHVGGMSVDTVDLLGRLGLGTCEAVHGVGESALIDRFGTEGKHVWQLVSGAEVRYLAPGAPPSDFAQHIEFESPLTSADHVVAATRPTIDALVNAIAGHGQQCVRMLVTCQTDHAEATSRIWGEPRGFGAASLAQRLLYQLDGWLVTNEADPDAPTSGVVRVEFTPLETREVLVVQPLLWGGNEVNTERAARAAAMASAVGDHVQVTVPRWEGGRDVATVYSQIPIALVDLSDQHESEQRVNTGKGVARDWSGAVPRPSPASVAVVAPEAQVLNAAGLPVSVTGRHELNTEPAVVTVSGHTYAVMRTAGPWPVEERWWDARRKRRHVRLQLLVQNKRGALRVFLMGLENHEWRLLARYD